MTAAQKIYRRAYIKGCADGHRAGLTHALSLKKQCEVNEADGVDSLKQAIRAELKKKTK